MLEEIEHVKSWRNELGLTQKQLADICGVSQSLIAKIESNKLDPSYSIARKILITLNKLKYKYSKKAPDIMSKNIVKVNKNDSVRKSIQLMKKKGFSQLPVFNRNHPVGRISEKIILDHISSGEDLEEIAKRKVYTIMDDPFPVLDKTSPINLISEVLKYNSAIIISEKHRPVGIITKQDLLKVVK